ncbi:MAG TPA: cobalamin-binding protein [Candidatus Limnocylindrales bacterium]|nr:cobalamin-binding protein [Candidatus Limnocylindrales bacterium]
MRIVSLLPSATEIVFALGLGDELVGVTHECDHPAEARTKAVVTRSVHDLPAATSREIHGLVEGSMQTHTALYELDEAALAALEPDLILTQELCRVCAVGYEQVNEVARRLDGDVTVLSLEPVSVEGILNSIQTVGAMTEAEDEAMAVVEELRTRLNRVNEVVRGRRDQGFVPPRVVALEWLDPPFAVGHWVPEQVRIAGGWELLGTEGGMSVDTTWDAVREVDPEVIVLMPCGFDLPRTVEEWGRTARPAGWDGLRAVREGRVFATDGSAYFSRPGPRAIDGIEVLAEIIDPEAFDGLAPAGSWTRLAEPPAA